LAGVLRVAEGLTVLEEVWSATPPLASEQAMTQG
jgi:hypothetical protein